MLTQTRQEEILKLLKKKGSVTVQELKECLHTSESTIRRDLNVMHEQGVLRKVFGGAVALETVNARDEQVSRREEQNLDEKRLVARYAASLIEEDDFVYLDAGTTTGCMIEYIKEKHAIFVTNAPSHAQKLAREGIRVILIGGRLKHSTEAVVGSEACTQLKRFNFHVGFFGTNGVSVKSGFSTPDPEEAIVKQCAMEQTQKCFVVCDHSKFYKICPVTFSSLEDAVILTDDVPEGAFSDMPNVVKAERQTDRVW